MNELLSRQESSFVAVYGRRRVGKTYLIRECFGNRFTFSHSAIPNSGNADQLQAFGVSLREAGLDYDKSPKNWIEAFELLRNVVKASNEKTKIIFIDELSWIDYYFWIGRGNVQWRDTSHDSGA